MAASRCRLAAAPSRRPFARRPPITLRQISLGRSRVRPPPTHLSPRNLHTHTMQPPRGGGGGGGRFGGDGGRGRFGGGRGCGGGGGYRDEGPLAEVVGECLPPPHWRRSLRTSDTTTRASPPPRSSTGSPSLAPTSWRRRRRASSSSSWGSCGTRCPGSWRPPPS